MISGYFQADVVGSWNGRKKQLGVRKGGARELGGSESALPPFFSLQRNLLLRLVSMKCTSSRL